MTASIAVLSDIHGMLPALEQVLAEPAVQSAELIVVTGDHTWGPQPAEVLDRLIDLGDRAVLLRGNADRELLQMAHGLDVGLDDDPLSVWGAAQLTPAHLELLTGMAEQLTLELPGFGHVLFCHATPRNDEEVVLVDSRLERWEQILQGTPAEVRTIVCGHTHMPFMRLAANRLVINPGSVGLPYGRAGAHWALLRDGAVTFARTIVDGDRLIREVASTSTYPQVSDWLEEVVRRPSTDSGALTAFASRDGRPAQ